MRIQSIRVYLADLALSKPYTIAQHTFDSVENVFLEIELANGIVGMGAASPAPEVVGETVLDSLRYLQTDFFQSMTGRDIRHYRQLITEARANFPHAPGALAAFDIALHDAFTQWLGVPLVQYLGQKVQALPTSVTIGIMDLADTLEEARNFFAGGFTVLKLKTGMNVEEDIERVLKLRETFGAHFTIRVDANQGYDANSLQQFVTATQNADIKIIEQPFPVGKEQELLHFPTSLRRKLVADESLHDAAYALQLAADPQPFGIYNIKLMKCGGILPALEIAGIAQAGNIDLFWGCNDESMVSISAALHAAFACSNTRYLDLDGSFDLAKDLVTGGFMLENGWMRPNSKPGLGTRKRE